MTDVNVLSNTRFGDSIRKVVRLIIDDILGVAACFRGRLLNLLFDIITIEGLDNLHADNRNILMLHRLTFMTSRNAKQKKQFLAVDEYAFIHYDCILTSSAWSTVVLVN